MKTHYINNMFLRFKRLLSDALYIDSDKLPDSLIHRALSDTVFLNTLIANRNNHAYIQDIIDKELCTIKKSPEPQYRLIIKGVKSLLRWAAFGFGRVSNSVYNKRIGYCKKCPDLGLAKGIAYTLSGASESFICNVCGCPVERKAILPTEQCPKLISETSRLTRWYDEPY
jgi:hypothetical protein